MAWITLGFLILSVLGNGLLISQGLSIHDSDMLLQPIWAERLLQGMWSAFPFQQGYGGTALAAVRALFVGVGRLVLPEMGPYSSLHFLFSYAVMPFVLGLTAFWACQPYVSKGGALWAGAVAAWGFHAWTYTGGADYYFFLILCGLIFLRLRSKVRQPFFQLPQRELFLIAIFSGFSLYNLRASLVPVLMYFIPWERSPEVLRRCVRPKRGPERWILGLVGFLLVVEVAIAITNGDWGTVAGHRIKLHAAGNHVLILVALVSYLGFVYRLSILKPEVGRRVAILSTGVLMGASPEIAYYASERRLPYGVVWTTFDEKFRILRGLTGNFREIWLGEDHLSPWRGGLRVMSLLLGVGTFAVLLAGARRRIQLWPPLAACALSIVAVLLMYVSGPGETRYLYPVYPVILLSIGLFWDAMPSRIWKAFAAILLISHMAVQFFEKKALVEDVRAKGRLNEIREVVGQVQRERFPVVVTDSYWHTHAYFWQSRGKIPFTSTGAPWGPPEAREKLGRLREVGVLLTQGPPQSSEVTLLGRKYRLEKVGEIRKLLLYRGHLTD